MHNKLKNWLNLIVYIFKPQDSSAGHIKHDLEDELPAHVRPRLIGVVKVMLVIALAILILRLLIHLFSQ